jgi:hypothetical protein
MITKQVSHSIEYRESQVAGLELGDENDDRLVLTLHLNGMITECNKAGGRLLDCLPSELVWRHISQLLPQLKNVALMQGQNLSPYLGFLSRIGYQFEVISLKGAHLLGKAFFCEIGSMDHRFLRVIICPLAQERMLS